MKKYIIMLFILIVSSFIQFYPNTDNTNLNTYNNINLYFNDPTLFNGPSIKTDSEIGEGLIELINQARSSIDFAVYGLSYQKEVSDAILRAIDRGVIVRGIVDQEEDGSYYYKGTKTLVGKVENIVSDYDLSPNPDGSQRLTPYIQASAIMHDKFFIIDKEFVWTGSTNVSTTGTGGYNANMACIVKDSNIAGLYLGEFSQMYEEGLFHNSKKLTSSESRVVLDDGTIVSAFFAPQENVLETQLIPLVQQAKVSINIPVFYLTHNGLSEELILAKERGVKVKVIIDAYAAQNRSSKHQLLRDNGIQVKVENWGGKMHLKTAIIDDHYLVVGSMNFTNAGAKKNDENILIIENDAYAKETNRFFMHLWNHIPDRYLTYDPMPESQESKYSLVDGIDNDHDGLKDESNPDKPIILIFPSAIIDIYEEEKFLKQLRA